MLDPGLDAHEEYHDCGETDEAESGYFIFKDCATTPHLTEPPQSYRGDA